jgi:putative chitinase
MLDRNRFFAKVRAHLFGGRMSASQVRGLNILLDHFDRCAPKPDVRCMAYMLATAHHETGRTMQPIRERGGQAYMTRMYDVTGARPALARRMGNTRPGDGEKYCGRGFVQLTWKANYRLAGEKLGLDLLDNPDLAMDAGVAARIMLAGMEDGWFTGRRLADHFTAKTSDWRGARRIINGLDCADLVKGYALCYHAALAAASAQPSAANPASSAPPSAKAQAPKAINSADVATSGLMASGPGA